MRGLGLVLISLAVAAGVWCKTAMVAGEAKVPAARQSSAVVNLADYADPHSATGGLQEAIDALPASGGCVILPPGEVRLRRSVQLRSQVTLQGAGASTVLRRTGRAVSKLTAVAAQGSSNVEVEDPTPFQVGDEVGIVDQQSVGWNVGHGIVRNIRGKQLQLDRPLPVEYDPARDAMAVQAFSALTGRDLARFALKDLAIEGQPDSSPHGALAERYLGFTFAAIHVAGAVDARIEGCRVRGWSSDGISLQRGSGNTVSGCWVQHCRGHGYHPGGGLRDSAFVQNLARGNGQDGLYFCMKVQHVVVSDNRFLENHRNGVGGLGDWGDQYNLVTNNVCQGNGYSGIWVVDGANNTVANNICVNNSQASPGQYSGILLNTTADTIVTGNRCLDDQEHKTQKHGILEFSNCHGNVIANNLCRGNAQAGLALAGKESQKSGNLE